LKDDDIGINETNKIMIWLMRYILILFIVAIINFFDMIYILKIYGIDFQYMSEWVKTKMIDMIVGTFFKAIIVIYGAIFIMKSNEQNVNDDNIVLPYLIRIFIYVLCSFNVASCILPYGIIWTIYLLSLFSHRSFIASQDTYLLQNFAECMLCRMDREVIHHYDSWIRLDCDHIFHTDCITIWMRTKNMCPQCGVTLREIPTMASLEENYHQQMHENII
jgi:hypothetical protein